MSNRELVVLGTASHLPNRERNHNGYLLRWDGHGFLFDPGEGTQRQMTLAGVSANDVTRICLTHFHGDHCLGLPGIVQRLSADGITRPVHAHYPASGHEYFRRLRYATPFHEIAELREEPVTGDGQVAAGSFGTLRARALDHRVDTVGYRLVEPDGHRVLPDRLARFGVTGPRIGELKREGTVRVDGRTVHLDEVSEPKRGQRAAFVMDTRLCDAVYDLADGVDLLVVEATYLDEQADLAEQYAHMTASQAGHVAARCGVRRLVLTHFSQRYPDKEPFRLQAAAHFSGDVVLAEDLRRIPVPARN